MRETRYYVKQSGEYIGAFEAPVDEDGNFGADIPENAIQVPSPPSHAQKYIWDFDAEEWADNPNYEPPPYTVRKTVIWSRTTEQEAETLDTALKNAPVKQRRMWDDSQYLDSADDLFGTLHSQMAQVFGAERADELLAPED